MGFKELLFEVNDGIAVMTLNRPETRNVINGEETIAEIEEVQKIVNDDIQIKVLIITGADPAFFIGRKRQGYEGKGGDFRWQTVPDYEGLSQQCPANPHGSLQYCCPDYCGSQWRCNRRRMRPCPDVRYESRLQKGKIR